MTFTVAAGVVQLMLSRWAAKDALLGRWKQVAQLVKKRMCRTSQRVVVVLSLAFEVVHYITIVILQTVQAYVIAPVCNIAWQYLILLQ